MVSGEETPVWLGASREIGVSFHFLPLARGEHMDGPHGSADEAAERRLEFAHELRRLRKAAGLTQPALARRMGFVREYVTLAESGRKLPSEEFARRAAAALNAPDLLALFRQAAAKHTEHKGRALAATTSFPELPAQTLAGLVQVPTPPGTVVILLGGGQVAIPNPDDLLGYALALYGTSSKAHKASEQEAMKRLAFLRLFGVAAGGTVAESWLKDLVLPHQNQPLWERLVVALDQPGHVINAAKIGELTAITDALRHLHYSVSARTLSPYVQQHLADLTTLLDRCEDDKYRRPLATNAAEVAVMAGLLSFFDNRDERAARGYYEAGLKAAEEAGDLPLCAHALTSLSGIALYGGQVTDALKLADTAQDRAGKVATATTRSFLSVCQAEAHASAGELEACRQALGEADTAMDGAKPDDDPGWVGFFDRARLEGYKGACYLRLGQAQPAQMALHEALRLLDPSLVKYRSINLADLAAALVLAGEIEEGCRYASESLAIAAQINYAAGIWRIVELVGQLNACKDTPAVKALSEQLHSLGRSPRA
jgi:transcriptional regulator with XRE-family HTH domain